MKTLVTNKNLLKQLEKQGFIKLHEHTGTKVGALFGGKTTAWYVDDGKPSFEFDGVKYTTEYQDGCFYPYVFTLNNSQKEITS